MGIGEDIAIAGHDNTAARTGGGKAVVPLVGDDANHRGLHLFDDLGGGQAAVRRSLFAGGRFLLDGEAGHLGLAGTGIDIFS